ncbi:MAG: hypothetical protein ACI8X3_003140, partial [Saprospiraceae bacterium]
MKFLKIDLTILTMIFLFAVTSMFAQQEDNKNEKKVVIITKTIDKDGNEVTKEIIKEGEDANVFILKHGEEGDLHLDKNVVVDIDDSNGETHFKIKIAKGDGDDDVEVIEWSGEGDMPAEMLKDLEDKGIHLDMHGDHDVFLYNTEDAANNACLGVMIGVKKIVENINGEETTTTEGESEKGVLILDIIENSGAADAGLAKDDIITEINGTAVSSIDDVLSTLAPFEAGATVAVNYLRDKQAKQLRATLKACANNKRELKQDFEWIDDEGSIMELKGHNWIFNGEEGEEINGHNRKIIIIKKSKDGEDVIDEEIELGGDEINEFSPEVQRTLQVQSMDIFPNPTDGKLMLVFTAPVAPTIVKVVDISGKEVYAEELVDFDGKYNKEIDLSKGAK